MGRPKTARTIDKTRPERLRMKQNFQNSLYIFLAQILRKIQTRRPLWSAIYLEKYIRYMNSKDKNQNYLGGKGTE